MSTNRIEIFVVYLDRNHVI